MGLIRLQVPERRWLTDDVLQRVHVVGLDNTPWPSRAEWDGDLLVVSPLVHESGRVCCPLRPEGRSELIYSTGTLMQRERPYLLDVELARGCVGQVRGCLATWEPAGLIPPAAMCQRLDRAKHELARAVAIQRDPQAAVAHARLAIEAATDAATLLGTSYAEQAIAAHRQGGLRAAPLFGINLGSTPLPPRVADQLAGIFQLAIVPVPWHDVATRGQQSSWEVPDSHLDWCERHGIKVCVGPLLQLDCRGIPPWLAVWEGNFESLLAMMINHVREVIDRYQGRVDLWQVASRPNVASGLPLAEQQRLDLLLRAIETVRSLDDQTSQIVMLDQPWAEYMAHDQSGLPPFLLADALLRANVGVAGLGLEINHGYQPGGTMPRSLLDFSYQLDRWSLLGVPLFVALTAPGIAREEATRCTPQEPCPAAAVNLIGRPEDYSAERQRQWVSDYLPLLLAKSNIQVLVWNQLCDDAPGGLPHAGLFDAAGHAKPVVDALRTILARYLSPPPPPADCDPGRSDTYRPTGDSH
jgi:hypothetical protein